MAPPKPTGIPPGMLEAVLSIVRSARKPLRRREILEELGRQGRTLSLAGLNRVLDYAKRTGRTAEGPEGVRPGPVDPTVDSQ
jgi:hypothetical protein